MMITMIIESCRLTPPHLMDFVAKFFSAAPSFLPASRRAPPFFSLARLSRRGPLPPTPHLPSPPPLPFPSPPSRRPFPPSFSPAFRLGGPRLLWRGLPTNLSIFLSIYLPIYLASYLSISLSLYLSLSSKTFKVYIATCFVFI